MGAPALFFCRVPPTAAGRGDLPPTGSPGPEPLRPARSPTGERTPAHPQMSVGAVRLHKSRGRTGGEPLSPPSCRRRQAALPSTRAAAPSRPRLDGSHSAFSRNGPFHPALSAAAGSEIRAHPAHRERGRPPPLRARTKKRSPQANRQFCRQTPTRAACSTAGKAASGKGSRMPVHKAAVPRRSRPSNSRQGRLPRLQTPSSPRGQSAPRAAPPGGGQRPAALYRQMAPVRFAPTPRREL